MDKSRTEEDKLCQAPITVILGGEKYDIKPLVIKDSRKWRKEVSEALSTLPKYAKATTDEPELFAKAMNQMLGEMPDTIIDLFFSYAKDLNRDEIEAIANDSEIAIAFGQVVDIAFPLARSLVGTMTKLSR